MSLGAFKIKPSIFEINQGQSIDLYVEFEPSSPSFYVSVFYNYTYFNEKKNVIKLSLKKLKNIVLN